MAISGLMLVAELLGLAGLRLTAGWSALLSLMVPLLIVAALVGGLLTALLDWTVLEPMRRARREAVELRREAGDAQVLREAAASRTEQIRRLRHDIRGALSPAMLVADRLINHADPSVQRSGQIMMRTIERATSLLTDPDVPPKA